MYPLLYNFSANSIAWCAEILNFLDANFSNSIVHNGYGFHFYTSFYYTLITVAFS